MRCMSIKMVRPAPIWRWPTSEFPMLPAGSPTAPPCVTRVELGHSAAIRSKFGVCAWRTALPLTFSEMPHPSRMHNATGRRRQSGGSSVHSCGRDRRAGLKRPGKAVRPALCGPASGDMSSGPNEIFRSAFAARGAGTPSGPPIKNAASRLPASRQRARIFANPALDSSGARSSMTHKAVPLLPAAALSQSGGRRDGSYSFTTAGPRPTPGPLRAILSTNRSVSSRSGPGRAFPATIRLSFIHPAVALCTAGIQSFSSW